MINQSDQEATASEINDKLVHLGKRKNKNKKNEPKVSSKKLVENKKCRS